MSEHDHLAHQRPISVVHNQDMHILSEYTLGDSFIDSFDVNSNYDSEMYMSGDEVSYGPADSLAHALMTKRPSAGFEDPFADATLAQYRSQQSETSPISQSMDRDSKYLSFPSTNQPLRLFSDNFQACTINIQAQLHGMFFLAESQFQVPPDATAPPPELTCYRRNLFQIDGEATVPKQLRYIFTESGQRLPIYDMSVSISATESVEGHTVKLISVPWKTPSSEQPNKDEKLEQEPPAVPLDKFSGADVNADFTTIPLQWKRLQFRIATANNGRRKELQQHFNIHLTVIATVSTGEKLCIAKSTSGAIIVRGRSPRNFAARKDVPLSTSTTTRKYIPSLHRAGSSQMTSVSRAPSSEQITQSFAPTDLQSANPETTGWMVETVVLPSSSGMTAPMPMASTDASTAARQPSFEFASQQRTKISNTPLDRLSLSPPFQNVNQRTSQPSTTNQSPTLPRLSDATTSLGSEIPSNSERPTKIQMQRHPSHNITLPLAFTPLSHHSNASASSSMPPHLVHQSSTVSSTDMRDMYEYIPLPIDEWQMPVDAVQIPHSMSLSMYAGRSAEMARLEDRMRMRSPAGRNKRGWTEVV